MKTPHPKLADVILPGRGLRRLLARCCGAGTWLVVTASTLLALESAQWRHQAAITVTALGVARLDLPPEVLDAAAANLADLRLLDPQGREVPFAWVRPASVVAARALTPRFEVKLVDGATVVTVRTGTTDTWLAAELETAPGDFMKSAAVDVSADGEQWVALGSGQPVFRRGASQRTRLPLNERPAAWVRITLDDRQTPPVPITGVSLVPVPPTAPAPRTVAQPVTISQREEFAAETVLTLDLGAAHLAVTALEVETSAATFSRRVTLTERRLRDEVLVEHPLAHGQLTRSPSLDPAAPVEIKWAPSLAERPLPAPREVFLHIDNGDSPPLPVSAVALRRLQRELVFTAEQAGAWTLLAGNPEATPPRYDFARFSAELTAGASAVEVGRLTPNPAYQTPPEALADVTLLGAALDASAWSYRRPVVLGGTGVQQLELDLGVLAHARTDFADLRLVGGGRQIPYLIEPSALSREFIATIEPADDPRRPQVSRWRVVLPQTGLPLRRLVVVTTTPLFQRRVRLLEPVVDARRQDAQRVLAEANWTRLPKQPATNLVLPLGGQRVGGELLLETDNGDNPPLSLTAVRGAVGVTRLLFKPVPGAEPPELIYGNAQVGAARYDLVLIAPQILGAPQQRAGLGAEAPVAGEGMGAWFKGRSQLVFLWVVLGGVVVVLLVIVARLLPKPENRG
jgi:hypothetical protein